MASTASAGPAAGASDVAVAADDSQDTSGTSSLSSGLLPVLDGTWSRLASEQLKAGIAGDDDATLRHLRVCGRKGKLCLFRHACTRAS